MCCVDEEGPRCPAYALKLVIVNKGGTMSPIEIVLLVLIGAAFVAVLVRAKRRGTCGDCSSSGSCSGHCSSKQKSCCPAVKGVDAVEKELSRGVK